jgi:ketosteroid isomerase-like protein
MDNETIPAHIIALEQAALIRWGKGDPSGFLEISAPDVVYFDPYVPRRIDGLAALTEFYQPIWNTIFFDRFELVNPNVQVAGDIAVLTFNYISYKGDESDRWNCTEVYCCRENRWQIIQSHWSFTEVFIFKVKS